MMLLNVINQKHVIVKLYINLIRHIKSNKTWVHKGPNELQNIFRSRITECQDVTHLHVLVRVLRGLFFLHSQNMMNSSAAVSVWWCCCIFVSSGSLMFWGQSMQLGWGCTHTICTQLIKLFKSFSTMAVNSIQSSHVLFVILINYWCWLTLQYLYFSAEFVLHSDTPPPKWIISQNMFMIVLLMQMWWTSNLE